MAERLVILNNNREIKDLDPLGIDQFMTQELPVLNNSGDVATLISRSVAITPGTERISTFTIEESQASLRDLGMITSSIVRHGIPLTEVGSLEETLNILGNRIGEVPRETVFHYGVWNPSDERMRTFTGTEEEKVFINSFRDGMQNLDLAILDLFQVGDSLGSDRDFVNLLDSANTNFRYMVDAIVKVRMKISPDFFTNVLRSYFPVLNIVGLNYQAPGGAQMPVILIDRILWGSSNTDPTYNAYYQDNLRYLPSQYRALDSLIGNRSLVSKFQLELKSGGLTSHLKQGGQSLIEIFNLLLQFRFPHLKTAQENFKLRPEGASGSGGYSPAILSQLLDHTKMAKVQIEELLK